MQTAIERAERNPAGKEKTFAGRKKRELRKNILFYAVLCLVGVFMILPTVVMELSSFKTYDEYYSLHFAFCPRYGRSTITRGCLPRTKIFGCGFGIRSC